MADVTADDFRKAMQAVDALGPPDPTIRFLTLGKNVVERLVGEGLLRHDAERDAYYLTMGAVGMGLYGFADVPVKISELHDDLIFGEYSDGTHFSNFETAAEHEN